MLYYNIAPTRPFRIPYDPFGELFSGFGPRTFGLLVQLRERLSAVVTQTTNAFGSGLAMRAGDEIGHGTLSFGGIASDGLYTFCGSVKQKTRHLKGV